MKRQAARSGAGQTLKPSPDNKAGCLILAPFEAAQLQRLRAEMRVAYESWLDTRALTDPDDLAARVNRDRVSALVVEADFVFRETFEACPSLRFVGICRAATNHVDIEAATERGVAVVNTPGRNARAVAEYALGLMLSLARRIPQAREYVAAGRWQNPAAGYTDARGVEIESRGVGIVGLGAIGRTLAAMCAALGMTVIAYDPHIGEPPRGVAMTDLATLAAESDFISVHAPATTETAGMLDANFFARMKPTAYLVNCSDYSIADESALIGALSRRRIAGAAFDVFQTHPIAPDSPLLQLDNVILTPHIGGATEETIRRHSRMMADDLLRFARGERPLNLVNPEVWPSHHAR